MRLAFDSKLGRPGSVFALSAAVAVGACGGGNGTEDPPTEPPETSPEVASVEVSPATATADGIGETVQFEASASNAQGDPVTGISFAWSSTDTEVATVDSDGTAISEAEGTARVVASAQGVADSATLTVRSVAQPLEASFRGPTGTGHPPDLDVAAGPDRLVAVTNGDVALYSKSGTRRAAVQLGQIWQGHLVDGEGAADPRVVYDVMSERFFLAAFGRNKPCDKQAGECVAHFLLAVSTSSSPDGFSDADWHRYAFPAPSDGSNPAEMFPDFPRLGITSTAVVLVGQMVDFDVSQEHLNSFTRLRILEKDALLDGEQTGWRDLDRIRDGQKTGAMIQPAKLMRGTPHLLMVSRGSVRCELMIWALRHPVSDPEVVRATAAGSTLDEPYSCGDKVHATQPEGAPLIETGGRNTLNAQPVYRDGSLWLSHSVEVATDQEPVLGVRWSEVEVTGGFPGAPATLQDTVFTAEQGHVYYPAVASTGTGEAVVVFGHSGESTFPSARFRTQADSAPANRTSDPFTLHRGEASLTSAETLDGALRFGDYFGAAPDPTDNGLWIIGEFVQSSSRWTAWIGKVTF